MLLKTFATASAAILFSTSQASAQALHEPPAGKQILGIWPQLDVGYQETPASLNQVYGFNFASFQLSQPIPVPAYNYVTGVGGPAPVALIEATGTDAIVYLTVYPNSGFGTVMDADLLALAVQCRTIQSNGGRTVFLRFAPEMNGNWMIYGLQPVEFQSLWSRMYSIIKAEAPDTVIVWSPNTGYSYPFGATFADIPNAADRAALDTNGDGQLTTADDPYSPYYPGDDQVDWVGVSIYYKGPDFANVNQDQAPGFLQAVLTGHNPYYPQRGQTTTNFYQTYCTNKQLAGIACMFSEAGAAFHSLPALVSSEVNTQTQIQQTWFNNALLNRTFWQEFPRMKAYWQFEQYKIESDGGMADDRDYRISNNTATLDAFLFAFKSVQDIFVYANSTLLPGEAVNTTIFEITPSGPIATATATVNITDVVVATYTQFYSGPFVNISYAGTADPLATATALTTTGAPLRALGNNAGPTQSVGHNVYKGAASSSYTFSATALVAGILACLMLFK